MVSPESMVRRVAAARPAGRRRYASIALAVVLCACSTTAEPTLPRTQGSGDPTATTAAPVSTAVAETTAASRNQADDWRDLVDATCETLAGDGYETRKSTLAAFEAAAEEQGEMVAATEALSVGCGDELAALDAALAVEARRDLLDTGDPAVTISDLSCSDGTYQFVATNEVDHAIGVHAAFRLFVGDAEEPTGSADYPIVIWKLGAGERQGITGEYHEPETGTGYRCNVLARVFDRSDDEADAAVPGRADPSLTGDDPAAWFGTLLGREVDAVGTGDPDAAAVTEDIRSTFYDNVHALNLGAEPAARVPTSVKICNGTVDRPDEDHLSFVYYVTYPAGDGSEGLLRHGLFRRGSDGQWRWLSAAHYFDSPDFWACGRPGRQD